MKEQTNTLSFRTAMDLTRFDDAQFDVKKWVNDTVSKLLEQQHDATTTSAASAHHRDHHHHYSNTQKIEAPLQQMVNKLQFLQQDLHAYLQQQHQIFVTKRVPVALIELQRCGTVARDLMRRLELLLKRVKFGKSASEEEEENAVRDGNGRKTLETLEEMEEMEREESAIRMLEQLHWLREQLQTCLDVISTHRTLAQSFAKLEHDLEYDRWMMGLPAGQNDTTTAADDDVDHDDSGVGSGGDSHANEQLLVQMDVLCREYETIEKGQQLLLKAMPDMDRQMAGFSREKVLHMREQIETKLKQFLLQLLTRLLCTRWDSALDIDRHSREFYVYIDCLRRIGRLKEILRPSIVDSLATTIREHGQFHLDSYDAISSFLKEKSSVFQIIHGGLHILQQDDTETDAMVAERKNSDDRRHTVTAAQFKSLVIASLLSQTVNNRNVVTQPKTLTEWTEEFSRAVQFYDEQMTEFMLQEQHKTQPSNLDEHKALYEGILRHAIFSRFDKIIQRYTEEEKVASGVAIASMVPNSKTEMYDFVNKLDDLGERFFHKHLIQCVERCRVLTFGVESQALVRVINDAVVKMCNQVESVMKDQKKRNEKEATTVGQSFAKQQQHVQSLTSYSHTFTLQSLKLVPVVQYWQKVFQQEFKPTLDQIILSWINIDHPLRGHLFGDEKLRSVVSFFKSVEMDLPLLDMANKRLADLDEFVHSFCVDLFLGKARSLLTAFESHYRLADDDRTPYDLPNFRSRSSSDYITQIGEWIITLPGQLEVLSVDNEDHQHADTAVDDSQNEAPDIVKSWLDEICAGVIDAILDKIHHLEQPTLSRSSWSQLHADVNYLNSVLEVIGFENSDLSCLLLVLDMQSKGKMLEEIKKRNRKLSDGGSRALKSLVEKFKS